MNYTVIRSAALYGYETTQKILRRQEWKLITRIMGGRKTEDGCIQDQVKRYPVNKESGNRYNDKSKKTRDVGICGEGYLKLYMDSTEI